jgi:DNA helicase HerA-like ATPase
MTFKLPGPTDRVSIIGSTGSGKTRFAAHIFSFSKFDKKPYVIVDFKGDDLLQQIDRAKQITLRDTPSKPGLYYVRPMPGDEIEFENFLWRIWKRGNIGIYIDEGYMVNPNSKAFAAILTQGRSLKIPCMTLTQRPARCSRFVFSEANHFALFRMNDRRDVENAIGSFTPRNDPVWDLEKPLAEYNCRWYDNKQNYSCRILPVPDDETILQRYDDALRVRNRGL